MKKPCCDNKEEMHRGAWSKQEDQKLIDYITKNGTGCWRNLPKAAGLLRCGKSCRLRWMNYLSPNLKRGNFSEDEEDLIIKLHALLGNRWSLIAGRLPGRTDNEVKNYWNSHLRRKLIKMGIDPKNHRISHYLHRKRLEYWSENSIRETDQEVVSDAGSSCAKHQPSSLPDLNSLPSIPSSCAQPYMDDVLL